MATLPESLFVNMSEADTSAIIQLLLADSRDVASRFKGKQREGTLSDAELALQMFVEELQSQDMVVADRRFAQSVATAVIQDGLLIQSFSEQEQQSAADRGIAFDLAGGNRKPPRCQPLSGPEHPLDSDDPWGDSEYLAKAAAIYMQSQGNQSDPEMLNTMMQLDSDDENQAGPSRTTSKNVGPVCRPCVVCGDSKQFFELARLPCNHEYCGSCLAQLFKTSMVDETLFPPRCDGQEIPLARVRLFLPHELAHEFQSKYNELSTKHRTYCHERTCATFIPNSTIRGDMGTCPRCSKTTCTICKSASHSGDCPEDLHLQELISTADAEQWQRCFQCHRFVDLQHGCNHITCPCGAQFCYVCGQKWHTCSCEKWDERRLYARAAQLVDRNPRRVLFAPKRVAHQQPATRPPSPRLLDKDSSGLLTQQECVAEGSDDGPQVPDSSISTSNLSDLASAEDSDDAMEENIIQTTSSNALTAQRDGQWNFDHVDREARIAETMAVLREHDCAHTAWRIKQGAHGCEECFWYMHRFFYECRQCQFRVCTRCRHNRL